MRNAFRFARVSARVFLRRISLVVVRRALVQGVMLRVSWEAHPPTLVGPSCLSFFSARAASPPFCYVFALNGCPTHALLCFLLRLRLRGCAVYLVP